MKLVESIKRGKVQISYGTKQNTAKGMSQKRYPANLRNRFQEAYATTTTWGVLCQIRRTVERGKSSVFYADSRVLCPASFKGIQALFWIHEVVSEIQLVFTSWLGGFTRNIYGTKNILLNRPKQAQNKRLKETRYTHEQIRIKGFALEPI